MKRFDFLIFLLPLLAGISVAAQPKQQQQARTAVEARQLVTNLLRTHPVIDGHNDFYHNFYDCKGCTGVIADFPMDSGNRGNTNIPLYRKGNVAGQLYNVYGKDRKTENLLKAFDLLHQIPKKYPKDFLIAATAADFRRAAETNKIALLPILEGAVLLQDSKELLRMYYKLGLRSVTFAYRTNNLADGSDDTPKHNGISPLGTSMVAEMNDLGILIDMSHISAEAMRGILKTSRAPVLFSHSNAYSLCKVNRNVPDDVLDGLKQNNGIIMINFIPQYISQQHADWIANAENSWRSKLEELKDTVQADKYYNDVWLPQHPQPVVTVSDVADHFDYIKSRIGVDHIGIGSDLGDFYEFTTKGMTDVSCFPALLTELAMRGWSAADLKKIARDNFLRVFTDVERQRKQ